MSHFRIPHLAKRILVVFFVMAWSVSAVAEEKNFFSFLTEPQNFSAQIVSNNSGINPVSWQQTNNTALLSPKQTLDQDPAAGMDLKISLDKIQFKSSVQQKKSAEDLFLMSHGLNVASMLDLPASSTNAATSIGYQLDLLNKKLSVVPMMGLSYHGRDDNRILQNDGNSEWNSWWVGLDLKANPKPDLSIETSFLFHNARFSEGMGSELYKADGEGKVFTVGLKQHFGDSWSAGILYSWQQWMAGKGELPVTLMSDKNNSMSFGEDVQQINFSLSYDF